MQKLHIALVRGFIGALFATLVLLTALGASPVLAQCPEDDPDCPLEPPQSEQVDPDPISAQGSNGEVDEPGALKPVESEIQSPGPAIIDPVPLAPKGSTAPDFEKVEIPMRWQDPNDVSCGVQALGMAIDGLGGGGPSSDAILGNLQSKGMMYEFGTGVEELAAAAQDFGYKGTRPFHNWSLSDLQDELSAGRTPVVAIGSNGAGQPGHFVTVTGISPDGKWFSYNDPTLGEQTVNIEEFNRLWGLQGNSGVAVRKTVLESEANIIPWVGVAASMMAIISQTPLALQRMGIGGRITLGGGIVRRRSTRTRRPRRILRRPRPRIRRITPVRRRPQPLVRRRRIGSVFSRKRATLVEQVAESPASLGGSIVGGIGAAVRVARPELLKAVMRAAPVEAPNLLSALRNVRHVQTSPDSLVGQLAEAKHFSIGNRLRTFVRTGQWIDDADDVYRAIVGSAPRGGRAPVVDFAQRGLRSRNPIDIIKGLIQRRSPFGQHNAVTSAKAGNNAFRELVKYFRGDAADEIPNLADDWRRFVTDTGKRKLAVTTDEAIQTMDDLLDDAGKLAARARQYGMSTDDFRELVVGMRRNSTSVGSRATLLRAVSPRPGILSKLNPRNIASLGGWVKAGAFGAAISGVFSGVSNYQEYKAGNISGSRAIGNTVADAIGGGASAVAGMYIGGVVGSFIPIPIVGTAIGMGVGFAAGAAAGWVYDKFARDLVSDAVTKVSEGIGRAAGAARTVIRNTARNIGDAAQKVGNAVQSAANTLGNAAKSVGDTLGNAASSVTNFFGGLFGGGG